MIEVNHANNKNSSKLLISSSQGRQNRESLCALFFTSLLERDDMCYCLQLGIGNLWRRYQTPATSKRCPRVYSTLSIEISYSSFFLDNTLKKTRSILFNPILLFYGEEYDCPHPLKKKGYYKSLCCITDLMFEKQHQNKQIDKC